LETLALAECAPRARLDRAGHLGVHAQAEAGKNWIGVVMSAGRMEAAQMRGLADIAARFGDSTLRLTVWQNLLIPGIADADLAAVQQALVALGFDWRASNPRGGLIACTGSAGCKFAGADTKKHAEAIARHLEGRVALEVPVNIHLTGCHHSCAQHYVGDIGLIATKIEQGEETLEGYHLHVGGGFGDMRAIAREIARDIPALHVPDAVARLLVAYMSERSGDETFQSWSARQDLGHLQTLLVQAPTVAA
jgi:ferredoxin-nitrite reductase